jgi:hypothetical protein
MHRHLVLAAGVIGLAWGSLALAQQAATLSSPVGPVVNRTVDTNQAGVPIRGSATQSSSFSWSGLFSKLNPFQKKPDPQSSVRKRAAKAKQKSNPPARVLP